MSHKLTHEEYVERLKQCNPNIDVVEQYKGMSIKIMHYCKIHDINFLTIPQCPLGGHGCPQCHKEKIYNKRARTNDSYIAELKIKNKNVIPLEQYRNATTPILHKCLLHDIQWKTSPTVVLGGGGCPQCHNDKIAKSKIVPFEEYLSRLKKKNPNIIVTGEYVDLQTKTLHKCLICGTEWNAIPSKILIGKECGCPLCSRKSINIKLTKTNEEYLSELKSLNIKIQPLEPYQKNHKKILHKCLVCNYEWLIRPDNILHGKGCPNCAGNVKKTPENYVELVKNNNSNIEVIDDYINYCTPIKHKCKIHNYIWNISPASILKGAKCPLCNSEESAKRYKKSHQKFLEELQTINPDIAPLEEYHNNKTKMLFQCLVCNYEWKTAPNTVLMGCGCPNCASSRGEKSIKKWLEKKQVKFEQQKRFDDCRDKRSLPFDFFLPQENKCIEYDGEQHYVPKKRFGGEVGFENTKKHDQIKNEYCKINNIPLLRIPYTANIEEELEKFLFN